jgi:Zn finger protein HypA/HybF involved in hydrogenase expression
MHETIIARNILEQARKKAKGKKIISITLEVGELAHLPVKELNQAVSQMADFKVYARKASASVKCRCGYKGRPRIIAHEHDFALFECPKCKAVPKIITGSDIILKKIRTA